MFIYRDPNHVPDAMKKIIYIQSNPNIEGPTLNKNIQTGRYQIANLTEMDHSELFERLKTLRTRIDDNMVPNMEYVITTDNFLKMNVIYLRVQSKVPVIIMGETGCGKTSLIKFLCENIRNEKLNIFNIHAGISYQMIINKMKEYIAEAHSIKPRKLWIFFDEFNTSENIGLICEVLAERTLLGEALPENMSFLAACNPYKLRSRLIRFDENVGIRRA